MRPRITTAVSAPARRGPCPSWALELPQRASGNTGVGHPFGNIGDHNRAGADNCATTDPHVRNKHRAGSYLGLAADDGSPGKHRARAHNPGLLHLDVMAHDGAEVDEGAAAHARPRANIRAGEDLTALTEFGAGGNKRRGMNKGRQDQPRLIDQRQHCGPAPTGPKRQNGSLHTLPPKAPEIGRPADHGEVAQPTVGVFGEVVDHADDVQRGAEEFQDDPGMAVGT